MPYIFEKSLLAGLVPLLAVTLLDAGCAAERHPLPGDSVSADGGVTLSPPRLSTAPPEAREAREGLGPVESRLFPPELVMDHQTELGIRPDQKKSLLEEIDRGQAEMLRLQWDLQREKEALVKLLDPDHVDEAKVRDSAARVMEHESRVKASHLAMLVRVKNTLTPEQLKQLRDMRAAAIATCPPPSSSQPSIAAPPLPPSLPASPVPSSSVRIPRTHAPRILPPSNPDVF